MLLSATPPSTFFRPNVRDFTSFTWTIWISVSLPKHGRNLGNSCLPFPIEIPPFLFAQNSPWDQNSLKSPSWTRNHLNSLHFGKTSFGGCHQLKSYFLVLSPTCISSKCLYDEASRQRNETKCFCNVTFKWNSIDSSVATVLAVLPVVFTWYIFTLIL